MTSKSKSAGDYSDDASPELPTQSSGFDPFKSKRVADKKLVMEARNKDEGRAFANFEEESVDEDEIDHMLSKVKVETKV